MLVLTDTNKIHSEARKWGTGRKEKSASRASVARYGLELCRRPIPHLGAYSQATLNAQHLCTDEFSGPKTIFQFLLLSIGCRFLRKIAQRVS